MDMIREVIFAEQFSETTTSSS